MVNKKTNRYGMKENCMNMCCYCMMQEFNRNTV